MAEAVTASSLKDKNYPTLLLVAVVNLAAFWLIQKAGTLWVGNFITVGAAWVATLPAGIGVAAITLFLSQISADMKARLVFWRWRNPLPGARAFTQHGPADQRVDMHALEMKFGPLPADPVDQNKLWYRLYLRVRTDPALEQCHQKFLLFRDYTFLAAAIVLIFGMAAFTTMPRTIAAIYFLLLVAQWGLATNSARKNGYRFVTTALALNGGGS